MKCSTKSRQRLRLGWPPEALDDLDRVSGLVGC
jgi:hypothetical protein